MAEAGSKPTGEDHSPMAATSDDDVTDTPRKSSSVKRIGSALKKVFTPRKSSGTSDEFGDVAEREPSDGSDGKKKKTGGLTAKIRSLSQRKTPRGNLPSTESSAVKSTEEEKVAEEKSPEVTAVPEEVAEAVAGKAKEGVEVAANAVQNLTTAADGVKEQVEQGAASAVEEAKAAVPDMSDAKPAAAIDVASSAIEREVDAAQAKVAEQVEKAQVATRAVEPPTMPVVEKKVEKKAEKKVEKKVEKPESKPRPRKRRGPVISGICIAVSIAFIAFKLAANRQISEPQGVITEPKARKAWEPVLDRLRGR